MYLFFRVRADEIVSLFNHAVTVVVIVKSSLFLVSFLLSSRKGVNDKDAIYNRTSFLLGGGGLIKASLA